MVEKLRSHVGQGYIAQFVDKMLSSTFIDELGYEGLDSRHANYLYRLVSARHGQGAIIVTANVGFSRWSSFFPSDSQAVPTVDRLLDRATILRFTGKSFRQPGEIHGAPLEE
ncbi:MAG: hypothetical protein FJW35_11775 [Acidobacteria bacterium]|nr:hypothetical protein [Acidobacteriota bacterium]